MATLHVGPEADLPTITAARDLAVGGDTVLVHGGVYHERIEGKGNVTFRADPDSPRAVLDGQFLLPTAFHNSVSLASRVRVEGFEIRNYLRAGVLLRAANRGLNTNHAIVNNYIHHIYGEPGNFQHGIQLSYGNNVVTGNEICHIGHGGECIGLWMYENHGTVVDGNLIYLCRKSCIRDGEGLSTEIVNNQCFAAWTAIELNGSTAPLVANNVGAFCQVGIYPKHTTHLPKWGLTEETLPAWARVWHNTFYRCRWTTAAIATNAPILDKLDMRNNIVAGHGGNDYIHDAPGARTANIIVDHNTYSTVEPRPQDFYRRGFNDGSMVFKTLEEVRADPALGWEINGQEADPQLIDPENMKFDYPDTSPALNTGASLPSPWGSQVGARGLPVPRVRWDIKTLAYVSRTWPGGGHLALFDQRWRQGAVIPAGSPQSIVADLGSAMHITHFFEEPVTHASPSNVKGYRWEVSSDLSTWSTELEGELNDSFGSTYWFEIPRGGVTTRYIRFTVLSNFGSSLTSISELGAATLTADASSGGGDDGEVDPPPDPGPGGSPDEPTLGGVWGVRA